MEKVTKKQQETIPESFLYFFKWLLSALVTVYTVLILGVLPFYFEEGYTHIGTDKSTFFKSCTVFMSRLIGPTLVVVLVFAVVVMLERKRKGEAWRPARNLSLIDYFALAYGVSVVLSYLCTDYRKTALWGTTGWFMGMLPHLTLVSIYFLVSRFEILAKWVLYLCLPVSAVVFGLGYLNRFDIWPLPMENSGLPNYISTVGNINWYCVYVVSILFVGVGLLWLDKGGKKWYKVLLAAYTCLGFAALITQGSDSGMFALAVVFLAMFVLSAKSGDSRKMKQFWLVVGMFALACLITLCIRFLFPEQMNMTTGIMNLLTGSPLPVMVTVMAVIGWWYAGRKHSERVWRVTAKGLCIAVPALLCVLVAMIAVNTLKPGSLGGLSHKAVFTFDDEWGSNRGATWRIGLATFAEQDMLHKFTGVGSDCMADYLYKGSSDKLRADVKAAFENKRLTNAHNEFLTILVNEGICGLVTYAGLFLGMLVVLLRAFEKNKYAAACGLCLLGYGANNLWSFQQSLSVSTMFVIMGLGAWFLRSAQAEKPGKKST